MVNRFFGAFFVQNIYLWKMPLCYIMQTCSLELIRRQSSTCAIFYLFFGPFHFLDLSPLGFNSNVVLAYRFELYVCGTGW